MKSMDTNQKSYNVESIRAHHPNAYAPWTPEDDAQKDDGEPQSQALTITPGFERALAAIERGDNVFITGRAGTGKSTLLRYFRDTTKKRPVVLAPTGVAAVNVGGQTIHSFFGFGPDVTTSRLPRVRPQDEKKYKALQTIIIDEISMVRADLLDCVNALLQKYGPHKGRPFGGVQMVFIGDLYQLPPVVTSEARDALAKQYATPYFFSARIFDPQQTLLNDSQKFTMEMIELDDVFRQRDGVFLAILNRIRNNSVTPEDLAVLNTRITIRNHATADEGIVLTTTNRRSDTLNEDALARLPGKVKTFHGARQGKFDRSALPTAEELLVKRGARVMLLSNDREGRWINGTLGAIADITKEDGEDVLVIELATGEIVDVARHTWDMYAYTFDQESETLRAEPIGSFVQFPIRLAWAVTIHKGQGKTFERLHIDLESGTFAPGQLYVALSRATTLAGMTLEKPVQRRHVWTDWNVVKFVTKYQYDRAHAAMPIEEKVSMITEAIKKKQPLVMTYLKARDEKSKRTIIPSEVGEMEYEGKTFLGMRGYCTERREDRTFRVDRILAMEVVV